MKTIIIDFETYYETRAPKGSKDGAYSLTKLQTEEYIRDPRFEAILLSYKVDNEDVKVLKSPPEIDLFFRRLRQEQRRGAKIALGAHNLLFDGRIAFYHYKFKADYYIDTLSEARALGLGTIGSVSLSELARVFGLPAKGTAVQEMGGKRLNDLSERELADYVEYCAHDTWLCAQLHALLSARLPQSECDWQSMVLEAGISDIIQIDAELVKARLDELATRQTTGWEEVGRHFFSTISEYQAALRSKAQFSELLEQLGGGTKFKLPLRDRKSGGKEIECAKGSKGALQLLDPKKSSESAALVMQGRLECASNIERARLEAFLSLSKRPMPIPLRISGAHTHRMSGAGGINLQNLPQGRQEGQGKVLRRSLCAPEGKVLVGADASQIEARLLAYSAQEHWLLNVFANRGDPYASMAAQRYPEFSAEEISAGNKAGDKEMYMRRQLGKSLVLGCLSEETEVLTNVGWRKINTVKSYNLLWDGENFVEHCGVVYSGFKRMLSFKGISMTPDHRIFCGDRWVQLQKMTGTAARAAVEFAKSYAPFATQFELPLTDNYIRPQPPAHTYDILNAGKNNRFFVRGGPGGTPLCVHNCGYRMGAPKYQVTAQKLYGLELTTTEAQEAVQAYRVTNSAIAHYWKMLDGIIEKMCQPGFQCKFGGDDGELFEADSDFVLDGTRVPCIKLPDGLRVLYPKLRMVPDSASYRGYEVVCERNRGISKCHGGTVAENITQALAIVIGKWQSLLYHRVTGLSFVLNEHDAWVFLADNEQKDFAVDKLIRIMSLRPPYIGSSCVLSAEGGYGLNYGDIEK